MNLRGIVLFLVKIFGSFFIVDVIFVGIFIILFVIFSCLFLGFLCSCMNGILGVIRCFFKGDKLSLGGFLGNCKLLIDEYGGILFFLRYL